MFDNVIETIFKKLDISEKQDDAIKARPEDLSGSLAFEALLISVGSGGKWQWIRTLFLGFMGMFMAFHNLGAIFLAATPEFECDNPYLPKEPVPQDVYDQILNYTTPWEKSKTGELERSKCHYYDRGDNFFLPNASLEIELLEASASDSSLDSGNYHIPSTSEENRNASLVKCTRWIYNQSVFSSTVVTEWNLVCEKQWLRPTIQSTYMLGIMTGAVVASGLSDRFGRRPALLGCTILFLVSGILTTFSTSLEMFLILRFIVGASGQGVTLIRFVIVMEVTGKKNRDLFGQVEGLGWTIGSLFLFVQAYYIRDWRNLQLCTSVSIVLALLMYWIVPESPRWLLMQGHSKEGVEVLESIGKVNGGRQLPKQEELDMYLKVIKEDVLSKKKVEKKTWGEGLREFFKKVFMLVKTTNMRRRSLIMFYNWFVVSMNWYGITFSGENISVSLHAMLAIGSVIGFPSTLLTYYSATRLGRRITLSYAMIVSGVFLIAIIFVPTEMGWLNLMLALAGQLLLGQGFSCVFFFATELVPTDIRNISLGISSMWARIGSAIGPYIVDLLGDVYYAIPSTVFGVLSIVAGLIALLLPETVKNSFSETIEEIELLPR